MLTTIETPKANFDPRQNWYHAVGADIEGMSLEDSLNKAGLNWQVGLGTINLSYNGCVIPDYRAVVRQDTERTLGIVGKRWTPIQNIEGAQFGNEILGTEGIASTAGFLNHGATVFIQYKIQKELYTVAGDEVETFLLLMLNHNGTGGCRAAFTNIRVVCQNTLYMALRKAKRAVSITHSSKFEQRMKEAVAVMQAGREYNNAFKAQADALLAQTVSDSQFERIMKTLLPMPEDASKTIQGNIEKEWALMLNAKIANDLQNVQGTGWGAYNAFVDHYDHNVSFRGTQKEVAERALMNTLESKEKDKALSLILAIA